MAMELHLIQFPAISACHRKLLSFASSLSNLSIPTPPLHSNTIARQKLAHPTAKLNQNRYKDRILGRNHGPYEASATLGDEKIMEQSGGKQRTGAVRTRRPKKFAPWVRSDRVKEKSLAEEKTKKKKRGEKVKLSGREGELRRNLDMCSKMGDLMGAIALYENFIEENVELELYHYNVLLYLCASAATGVVQQAKSGADASVRRNVDNCGDDEANSDHFGNLNEDGGVVSNESQRSSCVQIHITEGVREYARKKGIEIFERMCMQKISPNEATLTSIARIAMSTGDGDMAFRIVKQMKELGVTPRLRSYGPALFTFCDNGEVEKAFEVEAHMLEAGVQPEEPELKALLQASVVARRGDKVYYVLHKLRTTVRQVSPSVADLIETWFKSSAAHRFGKRKWDVKMVAEAMANGGGGWHGLGWLGKGKWRVVRSHVNADGLCMSCAEKLVTIDLDPIETENFAKSVASLANKRERNSSFQKFQKWLDYYGPFEAVIDAANVGLFSQGKFSISKVDAVANAIRRKLPMKRWPLIIVHNKRISGNEMNKTYNAKVLEKWKDADAIYATPTGSNDDWYWLYAAIKCKCLIVTNDEMRDHLFQTLGNDFFPRWKERHQVHFTIQDGSFDFQMPPPYSVVIQENERGHWHIPISMECEKETQRIWLCVTRGDLHEQTEEESIDKNI